MEPGATARSTGARGRCKKEPHVQAPVHPTRTAGGAACRATPARIVFPGITRTLMSTLPQQKLDEVRSIFEAFLKKRNKRQTPERFSVLEEIYKTDDHIDADELYLRLKQDGTRVSRATVYNTLELLMECELVVRHQFGKNQAKYERAYSYWQHDHLICMDCNELFEFCDPRLQSIQEMVAEIYEFEIKHHSLNMYGHCIRENCPNRSSDDEPATAEASE
jgi:Fur family ferric uptake transcriptional regulator